MRNYRQDLALRGGDLLLQAVVAVDGRVAQAVGRGERVAHGVINRGGGWLEQGELRKAGGRASDVQPGAGVAGGQSDGTEVIPARTQRRGRRTRGVEGQAAGAVLGNVVDRGRCRGVCVDRVGPGLPVGRRQVGERCGGIRRGGHDLALQGAERLAQFVVGRGRHVAVGVGRGEQVFLGVVDVCRGLLEQGERGYRNRPGVADRERGTGVGVAQRDGAQLVPAAAQGRLRGEVSGIADLRALEVVAHAQRVVAACDVSFGRLRLLRVNGVEPRLAGRLRQVGKRRRAGGGQHLALPGGQRAAGQVIGCGRHVAVGIGRACDQAGWRIVRAAGGIGVARDRVAAVGRGVLAGIFLVYAVGILLGGEQIAGRRIVGVIRFFRRGSRVLGEAQRQVDGATQGGCLILVGPRFAGPVGQRFGGQIGAGVAVVRGRPYWQPARWVGFHHLPQQAVAVAFIQRRVAQRVLGRGRVAEGVEGVGGEVAQFVGLDAANGGGDDQVRLIRLGPRLATAHAAGQGGRERRLIADRRAVGLRERLQRAVAAVGKAGRITVGIGHRGQQARRKIVGEAGRGAARVVRARERIGLDDGDQFRTDIRERGRAARIAGRGVAGDRGQQPAAIVGVAGEGADTLVIAVGAVGVGDALQRPAR